VLAYGLAILCTLQLCQHDMKATYQLMWPRGDMYFHGGRYTVVIVVEVAGEWTPSGKLVGAMMEDICWFGVATSPGHASCLCSLWGVLCGYATTSLWWPQFPDV
jgi:hypothetical protein